MGLHVVEYRIKGSDYWRPTRLVGLNREEAREKARTYRKTRPVVVSRIREYHRTINVS